MNLSSEQNYFLAMIRAFVAGESQLPAVAEDFRWSDFVTIVCQHPRTLQPLGDLIYKSPAPWETKTELAAHAKPMREHTQRLIDELPKLQVVFDQAGIDVITLKGPVIAIAAYPSPDLRFSSDIDLLVNRSDLKEACALAENCGYARPDLLRPDDFYDQQHFHHIFRDEDSGLQLEIHWDLTAPDDFVRFDLAAIRKNVRTLPLGETQISAMDETDLILHMVSQALPSFSSVGRLFDVALLIQRGYFEDADLTNRAKSQNLSTPLWLMLNLIRRICAIEISESMQRNLQPSWLRRRCIESLPIAETMLVSPDQKTGLSRLIHVLCCPNWKCSLKRVWRIVFPGHAELYKLGFDPDSVSLKTKTCVIGSGFLSVAKMAIYMAWRILRGSSKC